ncbi:hypothetical protein VDGE_30805 [Verticillium dahliae]|uniref:Uncharacterized protein n=1 Tax=Verticillium dahliae TaxID=27337 RepID=A0A444RK45_VERDA|nr:hypothetical protein VDGE_30805 [Verticillium dahliae]
MGRHRVNILNTSTARDNCRTLNDSPIWQTVGETENTLTLPCRAPEPQRQYYTDRQPTLWPPTSVLRRRIGSPPLPREAINLWRKCYASLNFKDHLINMQYVYLPSPFPHH